MIRKDILQVAREVPSDWVFKIGNEAQRRYQRAASSAALSEAQAGIERLLRKYKDQLEQRRNGANFTG